MPHVQIKSRSNHKSPRNGSREKSSNYARIAVARSWHLGEMHPRLSVRAGRDAIAVSLDLDIQFCATDPMYSPANRRDMA